MKQIIFLSMLMCVLPLAVFAMTCNSETLADGSNDISGPSALDNGTIDNCVDADVAAWGPSVKFISTLMHFVQQVSRK